MGVLSGLQPERVFTFFEELAGIPHGSGNTREISDHLVEFAKRHSFIYTRDDLGNVVIRKPGSAGYEDSKPVILQGHMDMVCEKESDCALDMEKEGLKLRVRKRKDVPHLAESVHLPGKSMEDDIIMATGTTLGADDGIAVAYMQAILEAEDIPHPPLECVFTVDEEIGMLGAQGLDMSGLRGRMLLNIDSEEEGHALVGCAGGCTSKVSVPVVREEPEAGFVKGELYVSGLMGGHSGMEIDKGRANANYLLGRVLQIIFEAYPDDLRLNLVGGGSKDNAITREAKAMLMVRPEIFSEVRKSVADAEEIIRKEYGERDPGISIVLSEDADDATGGYSICPMNKASQERVIQMLRILPNGIQKMSLDLPGFVETSLNLGVLSTAENAVSASFLIRSSVNSETREVAERLVAAAGALGGTYTEEGSYPAWEYRANSELSQLMCEVYREQFDSELIVETIHAGVECGFFMDGIPGLQAVSFGPDLTDIHTPKEAMDVPSVERTWRFILAILERMK